MSQQQPEPTECPCCGNRILPIKETANVIHCPRCGGLDKRTAAFAQRLRSYFDDAVEEVIDR